MFDWLSRLLTPEKYDAAYEEKLINEIEAEHNEELEKALNTEIPASVIMYTPNPNDNEFPTITVLVDEFKCNMLPQPKSIIHIELEGIMRTFKTIRYDFIDNSNLLDSMRVYIVVEPAKYSDVMPNPRFDV